MQEFYINKNSTLPLLKMELINDGRNNHNVSSLYPPFSEMIQRAQITFTMVNKENGVLKISKAEAFITPIEDQCDEEYHICYKWNKRDTNESGIFSGKFTITIDNIDGGGVLIVPIQDELVIYIN